MPHEKDIPIPWGAIQYEGMTPNSGSLNDIIQNLQRQILTKDPVGGGYNDLGLTYHADENYALSTATSSPIHVWNSPLTQDRSISLVTVGAQNGQHFTILRSLNATGAFNLSVSTLRTLSVAGEFVEIAWDGSSMVLLEYGFLNSQRFATLQGNLTTQVYSISMIALEGKSFCLRIIVDALGDSSQTVNQNRTYQEDVVIGYNAVGGPLVIQGVANLATIAEGNPATITYTVSGDSLLVNFAGADYTNALAIARIQRKFE